MGLLDIFGKKDVSDIVTKTPYKMKVRFNPYRISSKKSESVDVTIDLENPGDESKLTSVVIALPPQLGFDKTGLNTTREMRLGYLGGRENKEINLTLWGNHKTDKGEYSLKITAYCHYRDYAHVLNSVDQKVSLRVV